MSDIYANREYLIFPVSELNKVDFSQVLETSADTVRKSIDETKTFVKWNGEAPAFVATMTGTEGPYTHAEILDILSTSEWSSPMTGSLP
jgi:hypothetical protein